MRGVYLGIQRNRSIKNSDIALRKVHVSGYGAFGSRHLNSFVRCGR